MSKLSIVIPVYFNEDNLSPLYDDIKAKCIDKIDCEYEIIMVDDGSKDNSWQVICDLSKRDSNILPIKLSRNFGSHAAILCGLSHCTGDCAVVKSADLQEPSELVIDMFNSWKQGNKVVLAIRESRQDESLFTNIYYWLVRKFALPTMPEKGFDAFLVDKKVVNVLKMLDENNSALTCQILWSGFKTSEIKYVRKEREIGKSRWSLAKKIKLVSDTLFSFSNVPITLIKIFGFLSCLIAIVWAIFVLIGYISGNIQVEGFTTMFIFQLFSLGMIMLTLGILGSYVWRIFDASRNRPVYIVEEEMSNKNINEE